jgi:cold shock CspA family protein/uncharacterized LabA/DUF88 family protein
LAKIMVFIDGTWLYFSTPKLAASYGKEDFHVDYGKLPGVLAEEVGRQLGSAEVDVVRTYLFGSYAWNADLQDEDKVQRRLDFFTMLKEEFHYEVETFPINFHGRRLRREDRDPTDTFEPKEKCVDIALTTSMLYFAAIPYAYDIAIALVGDQDYKPVLQHVRRLGKRLAIASIKSSCAPEFADPRDDARVKDFDIIWIDDLLQRLELKYERHQLACESPTHKGSRRVWTTFHPRKGQRFYCDDCRAVFAKEKQSAHLEFISGEVEPAPSAEAISSAHPEQPIVGRIKKKFPERGFGFIVGPDGKDYFFHLTDLRAGLEFERIEESDEVVFDVKKRPSSGKAGAAGNVRSSTG